MRFGVNDANCLCWNELNTRDVGAAKAFYAQLLGWSYQELDGPNPYTMVLNHGNMNGGILDMAEKVPAEVPAHWNVYFNVEDVDQAVAKVKSLGGASLTEIIDIPVGRFGVVKDPQGASFTLIQLRQPND